MLILLNIIIIFFLLGSAAIWSTYGLFSSLLHLVIVIAAGVIALAMWEPLSYWLLGRMPAYAHGMGLIAPFAISLIILRGVFDKVCRMNVQVPRLADQIGGGVLGLFSGILAMGMFLNAVNFLPMARDAFGWEPYSVTQSSKLTPNDGGQLWGFCRVNEWSASFYTALANGSMRPISGPTLGEARPDLAERGIVYRLAVDENQMRAAHPENVKVIGLHSVPATEDALRALIDRASVQPFLAPGYELPDADAGEDGTGLVAAIFKDYRARHADPVKNGRPSEMLNIQRIMEVASSDQYRFASPSSAANFQPFVQSVSRKISGELIEKMKPVLNKEARLVFVDTRWTSKPPAAFNSDSNLRLGMTQVALQTRGSNGLEDEMLRPVGFSIEYSQNSKARTFTEVVGSQAFTANSPYSDFSMGLAFIIPNGQQAERLYIRELRFDLTELPQFDNGVGAENPNVGEMARVMGMPLIVIDDEEETDNGSNDPAVTGRVAIGNSGAFAEVSEQLPMQFSNTSAGLNANEEADPWTLISGKKGSLSRGKGGKTSTVREIQVAENERLVRIELDTDQANSLYGRAIALAGSLGAILMRDEAGNDVPFIGYAYVDSTPKMDLDIRVTATQRTMIAKDLPAMRPGDKLYLYFRAPVGKRVTTFVLGSDTMKFDQPLEVIKKESQ